VATAAVADQRDAAVIAGVNGLKSALDSLHGAVRAADVGHEPAHVRPVSDSPQPGGEHEQRLVTAAQAGHQDHRPAIAAGHAASAKDRIDEQPAELELPADLAEMISPPTIRRQQRQVATDRGWLALS
jgi:hypothetical protein